MLEQLTAQVEASPPTPVVPREFYGRARDIRRQIEREDATYDAAINRLTDPVRARLQRFPHRSLRQETLNAVITGWMNTEPHDWRLSIDGKLDKRRASLRERRISAGRLYRAEWNGGDEPDIGVTEVMLTIDRHIVRVHARCLCTFSLHAVARRLQRGADGSLEALVRDIDLGAQAACGTLTPGAGYQIRTDEHHGGGWRGRCVRQRGADGVASVLSIRTWL